MFARSRKHSLFGLSRRISHNRVQLAYGRLSGGYRLDCVPDTLPLTPFEQANICHQMVAADRSPCKCLVLARPVA